jgi:NAD(P)-dependent dehydrogenase (short-subunit alcohol dehydrogenase family)
MDLALTGKRAIVTGSTGGIGEGIAKMLAQEGAAVAVQGRNESAGRRVQREIEAVGGKAILAIGDLSTDEGAKRVVEKALDELGAIDILVNNAGAYEIRGWADTTPQQWLEVFNQNVVSMVRMIRLLVPQMRQSGWGRIIQLSSAVGVQPLAALPDYNATKAAVINMTVSLAKELANTGVTVNTVSPGPIMTSGWIEWARGIARDRGWGNDMPEIERRIVQDVLPNAVGRVGRVDDIATLVSFIASPLAGFINGANLRVDGGSVQTVN